MLWSLAVVSDVIELIKWIRTIRKLRTWLASGDVSHMKWVCPIRGRIGRKLGSSGCVSH